MYPEVTVSLAHRVVRLSIASFLLWLLATATATAQTTGTIRGTVVDVFGDALPGVLVTATGSGVDAEVVTEADGTYEFTGLAAGDHLVTATLFGYASRELRVTVRAGAVETVPIVSGACLSA